MDCFMGDTRPPPAQDIGSDVTITKKNICGSDINPGSLAAAVEIKPLLLQSTLTLMVILLLPSAALLVSIPND